MQASADLRAAVARATPMLLALLTPEAPLAPGKWSAKQVIGHLIDSASNNHQRFVRAQFTTDLTFAGYEQERWVDLQGYQDEEWVLLVTLWRTFNLHLAHVMEATPESVRQLVRTRHNCHEIGWRQFDRDEPVTLEEFMSDYVAHLEHHLAQILPRGPVDQ